MMKTKILTVINSECYDPIHIYVKVCDSHLEHEVRLAFETIYHFSDYEVKDEEIKDIASELEHGRSAWHEETYGFELIYV